uniref:Uncharacterized protein n=1 Tax=Tanacetum cinerariifolium TaxID=118510 RepID=A0A699GYZ6_TANCI|nr:hypothetical protein [Tanacetum cinerariifolium]
MATMAENVIVAGSETRLSMLEKGMYDSWKTQIILYIRGKENGEMLKDSIDNDLAGEDKLCYDSDIKAVNVLLLELPVDIYTLINQYQTAKEIWDRIKELMECTEMTKQERESMLYDHFDKFTYELEESIHSYYLRYVKLINDINMIPMSMTPMQINTKFVNYLQLEWSRFVIAAKQARDLHSVTFDQLYAFLKHNEKDAKEVPEIFAIPTFLPADDPMESLHKAMIFLILVYCSKFPPTNNQLQTSSNPRTQATIQNCQVTVQKVQGHIAKQCTARKRLKDSKWIKDKMLLAQAQEARVAHRVDAYDSDCDDEATTNAIFMEILSSVGSLNDDTVKLRYDSDMLSAIVEIILWYLDSRCSKHMTGHRDKLINFVSKFIRTVRFGNDHYATIMGYEDLQMGNILISRVYYVKGLCHNLFFIGKFCDSFLEVAFRKYTCFVQNLEGVDLLSGSREEVGITHNTSNARTPQQNSVVERRNRIEVARTMLIFLKSLLFLWAEAVATACYTQNHSLIHTRYNKTLYELLRDRKPEIKYLHVFGALCYPTNDFKDLEKLQPKAYIGIFIGYSPSKMAYRIYNKRFRQIMETTNVQFDELTHMASKQHGSGPDLQDTVGTSSSFSTSIDKDAPSPSTSPNNETTSPPINFMNFETNEEVAVFNSDTFTNPLAPQETSSAESSSRIVDTLNMYTFQQPPINIKRWTKDHMFTTIIGDPSEPSQRITKKQWKNLAELKPCKRRSMNLSSLKYGKVYVSQPEGFVNPDHLNHVFKLKKVLYGLKQAPRAWYDLLSKFLLSHKFVKGVVDPTLFTRKEGNDLILYGLIQCDVVDIPMAGQSKLDEDPNMTLVDPTRYQGMVGSHMYLTASRPDLVFVVCMCARYQAKPTEKHLTAILWIRSQLTDYGFDYNKIPLYSDSQSTIALSCNTPGRNTSMFDTTLLKSKLKMRLLSYTLLRPTFSWRISSLKHSQENASNF